MPAALGLSTYRWNNNIRSVLLLLAFPLLLLGLMAAFFALAGAFYLQSDGTVQPGIMQTFGLGGYGLTPVQMATTAVFQYWPIVLGVAAVWVLVGYMFNDAMIRAATGARPVERREAAKLYNLLENLCIARGLKMPRLYVIEGGGLNAFASGLNEGNYSITVTRGLLERLDDAEIEAVLAHELTHIMNRDVRLLVIAIVFTGMISFIAQMMWRSLRFASYSRTSGERREGGGALALMLLASVLLAVGYLLALALRFALSRRREYLADAGSVELTKNPEALISALEKISNNPAIPHVPPEVQQMFIENPPSLFGLFDTHPSIPDRIRVLRELGGLPPRGESVIPRTG